MAVGLGIILLSLPGCGSTRRGEHSEDGGIHLLDAGHDGTDAGLDAALDDAGSEAGADAAADASANEYPCEENSDCADWWDGLAFCWKGSCCLGHVVEGQCMCGDRIGGCPPDMTACCETAKSPDEDACTWNPAFCESGI